MVVYYTGTGNSRYVAQRFAAALGDERALGSVERLAHDLKLLGNEQARHGGKIGGHACGGRGRAGHCAKRVGDVQLRH